MVAIFNFEVGALHFFSNFDFLNTNVYIHFYIEMVYKLNLLKFIIKF